MTDEPFFFVEPASRDIEQRFRTAGEAPYVATVLTMLDTQFEPASRGEAKERTQDGTWKARSTILTDEDRTFLTRCETDGLSPLVATHRLYVSRLSVIKKAHERVA